MPDPRRIPIERLIEVAIFAPIGVALTLRDMAPTFINAFVSRGRTEVDRTQQAMGRRFQTVRSTGEVALAFGLPMVRRKVSDRFNALASLRNPAGTPGPGRAASASAPDDVELRAHGAPSERTLTVVADPDTDPAVRASSANGADLAIPGYDELAASQVVERLVGLSHAELDAVRRYESSHRNRRTILGKIEQLASA